MSKSRTLNVNILSVYVNRDTIARKSLQVSCGVQGAASFLGTYMEFQCEILPTFYFMVTVTAYVYRVAKMAFLYAL